MGGLSYDSWREIFDIGTEAKGNVINNKNVDCFIAGYNTAAKEYREVINKGYKEVFTGLPDKLEKQLEDDEVGLGYSGYMYSYPDWFIKKKSAYIALSDALKQCEEFINDIKMLLWCITDTGRIDYGNTYYFNHSCAFVGYINFGCKWIK